MLLKFLKRKRARPSRDPKKFAHDAGAVMMTRIAQGLTGRLTAEEARRMVLEKQSAAMRAQFAYLQHLLTGDPRAANAAVYDIYDRTVRSNRKRLKRRRRLFG
jgi:hypothetical protein